LLLEGARYQEATTILRAVNTFIKLREYRYRRFFPCEGRHKLGLVCALLLVGKPTMPLLVWSIVVLLFVAGMSLKDLCG